MRARCALLLGILLVVSTATAQWRRDGDVVPDEPWRRADGAFGAMLLLTSDPDGVIEQWSRPAAPDYAPSIRTVEKAGRGDIVAAMIVLQRCSPDATGSCRVVADFRVLRPDGRVYGEQSGASVWRGPPAPEGRLLLGESHLGFEIEPDDPTGTYRIQAVVRDLVSQRSLRLVQTLTVLAAARGAEG